MRRALSLVAAVCVVTSPGTLVAQSADQLSAGVKQFVQVDAPVVALTHVTLIDGTGSPTKTDQTILIEDGRIAAVGSSGQVRMSDEAHVIDMTGYTVIPGMVGLHNHMFFMAAGGRMTNADFTSPRLYLGSGVTTIRTTGSVSPYADINTKKAIEDGRSPGPRIHVTAPYITGPGTNGDDAMAQVTSPEQARAFVRYWAGEGATWIKAYTDISRADLGAAIEEAHAQGMKATGHLCSVTFREAVALGIDNLEHGFDTATDFDSRKEPDKCPSNSMIVVGNEGDPTGEIAQDVIRTMLDNDVGMTSTMAVIEPFIPNRPTKDPRTLEVMAPEVREAYLEVREVIDAATENYPFTEEHLTKSMQFEVAFVEAGGLLAAGVDPTGIGGAIAGFGDQRNYQLFIEAGFSPETAVQIMSLNGAKILGVDEELGSVEVGKLADLAVMEGDLSADPAAIRAVKVVYKDGVGYDSDKLIESVVGRVGIN